MLHAWICGPYRKGGEVPVGCTHHPQSTSLDACSHLWLCHCLDQGRGDFASCPCSSGMVVVNYRERSRELFSCAAALAGDGRMLPFQVSGHVASSASGPCEPRTAAGTRRHRALSPVPTSSATAGTRSVWALMQKTLCGGPWLGGRCSSTGRWLKPARRRRQEFMEWDLFSLKEE